MRVLLFEVQTVWTNRINQKLVKSRKNSLKTQKLKKSRKKKRKISVILLSLITISPLLFSSFFSPPLVSVLVCSCVGVSSTGRTNGAAVCSAARLVVISLRPLSLCYAYTLGRKYKSRVGIRVFFFTEYVKSSFKPQKHGWRYVCKFDINWVLKFGLTIENEWMRWEIKITQERVLVLADLVLKCAKSYGW